MQGSERSCKGPDSVDRGYHRRLIHGSSRCTWPFYPARPPLALSPPPHPHGCCHPRRARNSPFDAGLPAATELAAEQQVSRKFVYQQLRQAHDALDHAFNPGGDEPDQLLFWLPVTKPPGCGNSSWVSPSSATVPCSGVTELLADVGSRLSAVGRHRSQHPAPGRRRCTLRHRSAAFLAAVQPRSAHDEIFQAGQPVLVGADVALDLPPPGSVRQSTATPMTLGYAC